MDLRDFSEDGSDEDSVRVDCDVVDSSDFLDPWLDFLSRFRFSTTSQSEDEDGHGDQVGGDGILAGSVFFVRWTLSKASRNRVSSF